MAAQVRWDEESIFIESHSEMNEINREEISAYATNHFSFEAVGKQFMNAYEQALNK